MTVNFLMSISSMTSVGIMMTVAPFVRVVMTTFVGIVVNFMMNFVAISSLVGIVMNFVVVVPLMRFVTSFMGVMVVVASFVGVMVFEASFVGVVVFIASFMASFVTFLVAVMSFVRALLVRVMRHQMMTTMASSSVFSVTHFYLWISVVTFWTIGVDGMGFLRLSMGRMMRFLSRPSEKSFEETELSLFSDGSFLLIFLGPNDRDRYQRHKK